MATNYYQETSAALALPALEGERETRVAIVGGGYAGLCTALSLIERGVREVAVLEAREVGFGASGRNGGFVFPGYSLGEEALLRRLGPELARRLFGYTLEAVARVRERIRRHGIDCEAVEGGVLWADWFRGGTLVRRRQALLAEAFGLRWPLIGEEELRREHVRSRRYSAALLEEGAFHVHPLKLARGYARAILAGGGSLWERSPVIALRRERGGFRLRTPGGSLRAEQVVLAPGGLSTPLVPRAHRALLPIATYVMASEPLGSRLETLLPTSAAVYDTRFAFDYYRRLPDGRLLWGGRISIRDRSPAAVARLLRRDLVRVFPELAGVRIDYAWSGLMGYSRHKMPHIGPIAEGLWLNQGYGGHGVATTAVGGELIAEAIVEGGERWRDFAAFPPSPAWGWLGLLAAEATYRWLGLRDRLREWREGEPD
ncbi:MAG: FAD-binding oxidoreductase [Xanthomonadales bacterium]|nr:FAD-binding oxidoreductase [Xanthomonadales bacterium]